MVNIPRALPITVVTAVTRPQEIALAIVKRTLGPGTKMMSVEAMRYSQSLEGMIKVTCRGYLREVV